MSASATGSSHAQPDDGNVDFDTQIRLEQAEAAARADGDAAQAAANTKTRTDDDGTVFDWDDGKQAWFPRIDSEMLIRYQLGYGTDTAADAAADAAAAAFNQPGGPEFDSLPPEEQEKARQYWEQYYNSQEYRDWYTKYSETGAAAAEEGQLSSTADQKQQGKKREAKKNSSEQQQQQWFEVPADQNTHVFVQNLPLDLTEAEFIEFMSKCGMVLHDPLSRKPKVKLYLDEAGKFNGSARCGYIKKESVALALQILDGYQLRGCEISVEPAKFLPKAGFDPSKRRRLTNKEKKKVKEHQARLLAWAPADSAASADGSLGLTAGANAARRSDRVLVVSNVFSPSEFDSEPLLVEKIRDDLVQRCSQFGSVRKAVLHDRNQQGVVLVTFAESGECSLALSQLNGRIFRAGRVLKAEIWDGRTRYHVEETEEQAARRRAIWERQILGQEADQPAIDNPPSESAIDNPPSESAIDNPPSESAIDNPPSESAIDNPPSESAIDNPLAEPVKDAESTDDEALVSSSDDENY